MIKFLKDSTVYLGRRVTCGDECCSWFEYADAKFAKGEELDDQERNEYDADLAGLKDGVDYERVINCENLAEYCSVVANILTTAIKEKNGINVFMHYRYRMMRKLFPHEPFSVEQGEYNFFEITHKYLIGVLSIDDIKPSDYNNNYVSWVKKHKI